MTHAAASTLTSTRRPLRLRPRADLVVRRQEYEGRSYWVIKDPVALAYYRFQEEEYALLRMLDGAASLEEIRRRFEREFPPQKITVDEVARFVGQLHQSALLAADAPGQGDRLLERRREQKRRQWKAAATNILCIRFKGFDPDRLLAWLNRGCGWLFSPAAVALCAGLMLAAALLIAVEWEVFRAKLPTFREFFGAGNWLWLALALGATKILHELGHGLACKRLGGECHEMGVMILVLTPCLYCNVSDAWMLPDKWRRAAIGAAGMYVELVIAAACTFLWWLSEPGMLNALCLNVMFVSSVSTVLFNANPLLRYDGYYILADLIEIPNLRQKAGQVLARFCRAHLLGMEEAADPFLPQRRQAFFAAYAAAAGAYRWVVTLSILWFLDRVLAPYDLKSVSRLIALAAIYALVVHPLWQALKFFHVPGRIERVNKPRTALTAAGIALAAAAVLFTPLPYRVPCTLEIQPRDATPVYVNVGGSLAELGAAPGRRVAAGQLLARLESVDVDLAIAQLEAERNQVGSRLDSLRQRAFTDEAAALEVAHVAESLAALDEQLAQRRRDRERLAIVAPVGGVVLPPPVTPRKDDPHGRLPRWAGLPLDEANLGAPLASGVLLCRVGDPQRLEAVLAIDQSLIEFVRPGQRVDVQLDGLPGRRFTTHIEQVSTADLQFAPAALSAKAGGVLPTRTDAAGRQRPLSATYQASAPLEDAEGRILLRTRGEGRIHAGWRSLGFRLARYLSRTFNFRG